MVEEKYKLNSDIFALNRAFKRLLVVFEQKSLQIELYRPISNLSH